MEHCGTILENGEVMELLSNSQTKSGTLTIDYKKTVPYDIFTIWDDYYAIQNELYFILFYSPPLPQQAAMRTTMIAMNAIPRTIAIGIHSGAETHHQLQLMTFVSLRTMNVMNSNPKKLTPP